MRASACGRWLVLGAFLTLTACGGSTSRDDSPGAGGTTGSGGSAGSGASSGSGGAAACSCAPPLVCSGADCVEPLRLVSVTPAGKPGGGASFDPDISRDGHVVIFTSNAMDLSPAAQGEENVYSRHLPGAETTLVSVTGPTATAARSNHPAISPGAEYATFASTFSFFATDQNQNFDVLVSDLHSLNLELLSTTPDGNILPGASIESGVNEDGGRLVFSSDNGLVPEDDNDVLDVYLVERGGGPDPVLVSTPSPDTFPSSGSFSPCISANGRFVVFVSSSPDAATADDDQSFDVFLKDLDTGSLERLTPSTGAASDYFLLPSPRLSAAGEVAVFAAQRPLLADDTNGKIDIYAWRRATAELVLVSRSPSGKPANGDSMRPSISDDGRFVAFESWASDLVLEDSNETADIFVADLQSSTISLLSRGSSPSDGPSHEARISGNGRFVAFDSSATNLIAADDNLASDVFVVVNPLAP